MSDSAKDTQLEVKQGIDTGSDQWSHVFETINMLYLAVCQIETTMADSNGSVDTLTNSFTQLAEQTNTVSQQIQDVTQIKELQLFKDDLAGTAKKMNANINSSVQAFQFYDRVCQRLDHVSKSLEKVTTIMADQSLLNQPSAWKQIQYDIKSSYTMEAERIMFEYIMRGGNVKEALKIYRHHFENAPNDNMGNDDEVELF